MKSDNAVAVMDASIAYGASRCYREMHSDPNWAYKYQYKESDDKALFLEFLHAILLYDKVILDKSSVSSVALELRELFQKVNLMVGHTIIAFDRLTDARSLDPVRRATCELVKGVTEGGIRSSDELTALDIPWAYTSVKHDDFEQTRSDVRELGLNEQVVPACLFAYRGLCYSGFANGLRHRKGTPSAYIASPGRMKILSMLLDARDVADLRYPSVAYRDLVSQLTLPKCGYSFSHIRSIAASRLSELSLSVGQKPPSESLRLAVALRETQESIRMREKWAERLWARSMSSAVGTEMVQSADNLHVDGSLTMIQIHGSAID